MLNKIYFVWRAIQSDIIFLEEKKTSFFCYAKTMYLPREYWNIVAKNNSVPNGNEWNHSKYSKWKWYETCSNSCRKQIVSLSLGWVRPDVEFARNSVRRFEFKFEILHSVRASMQRIEQKWDGRFMSFFFHLLRRRSGHCVGTVVTFVFWWYLLKIQSESEQWFPRRNTLESPARLSHTVSALVCICARSVKDETVRRCELCLSHQIGN